MLVLALLVAGLAWRVSGDREAKREDAKAARGGPCETREFEGSTFTACLYDSRAHRIAIMAAKDGKALRSFARLEEALGGQARDLLFAMNAGMYDEAGMPIGLHVEAGRALHPINLRDGPGNFHMKPNGVFAVGADGRVAIVQGDSWRRRKAEYASQSGPMLLIGGELHPMIQPNGTSLQIRNGVGTADGRTAWFAISEEPVSFGRFARFFRDSLGCRDALFFDGAVSSLWHPGAGRRDEDHEIGPMVAVFRRR